LIVLQSSANEICNALCGMGKDNLASFHRRGILRVAHEVMNEEVIWAILFEPLLELRTKHFNLRHQIGVPAALNREFASSGDFTALNCWSAYAAKKGKSMFSELMPLIERRAITITVAALNEGHVRVNVVSAALAEDSKVNEKIGYSNKDKIAPVPESAIHALTTPLSLTGTPDEIDTQLAEQLKTFVDSHLALQQSLDRARQEISDAVKTVEERDKNRSKAKPAAATKSDEKNPCDKREEAASPGGTLSLFDSQTVVPSN
jgi:PRTRC genetic system protein E